MKPTSQITREEKLQGVVEYNPYGVGRSVVLRCLLTVYHNDTKQVACFGSFGKSVRHIILNVRTYERRVILDYVGKQFNEYGWINGMLPIIEEIRLDTFNTIYIERSVDGTYAVTINWCTDTVGGGSHPSVWDEPVRDYKEAI